MNAVRRALAATLVVIFSLPLIAPLLASTLPLNRSFPPAAAATASIIAR
jgi:hypothetical protein